MIYQKEHSDETDIQVLPPLLHMICAMKYTFLSSSRPSGTHHFSSNSTIWPFCLTLLH